MNEIFLKYLVFSYTLLIMVSLVISLVLLISKPNQESREAVYFWLAMLFGFAVQGAAGMKPQAASLAIFSSIPITISISRILCRMTGHSLSLTSIAITSGSALAAWLLLYVTTSSFWLYTLPASLAVGGMFFGHAWILIKARGPASWKMFAIAMGMTGLHILDYPFLRLDADYTLLGFAFAYLNGTLMAILLPIITLENIQQKYNEKLQENMELIQADLTRKDAEVQFKSAFIANVSHEIRTPLSAIRGFAELLGDGAPKARDSKAWISSILRASQQLELLVNDILDLSKAEAGKIDVDPSEVCLKTLISDLSELLAHKASERGLYLRFAPEGSVPASITTDMLRLKQVLINVIGNALKFTEHGGVDVLIRLDAGRHQDRPHQLVFTVKDTGVGLSPDQAEQIFQAFTQADLSTTRRYGGTGLGLSLARCLAQLLGGDVILNHSELGKGSTFTITIDPSPLPTSTWLSAAEQLSVNRESSRATPSDQPLLQDIRILVVDDAPDLRAYFSFVLSSHGATVELASQADEGLQWARKVLFDVILMDIQMPDMDGYEATEILRAEGFTLPIIAVTAHAMKGEQERCLDAGFTAYASKPVNIQKLIGIINSLCAKDRASVKQPSSVPEQLTISSLSIPKRTTVPPRRACVLPHGSRARDVPWPRRWRALKVKKNVASLR